MFEKINVWHPEDSETLVCYRIFRSLSTGKYYVQSKDFIRSRGDLEASIDQSIELFLEDRPDSRGEGFDSIATAIASFDSDFDD